MPATRDTPPVSAVKAVLIRIITIPEAFLKAEGDGLLIPINDGASVQALPNRPRYVEHSTFSEAYATSWSWRETGSGLRGWA